METTCTHNKDGLFFYYLNATFLYFFLFTFPSQSIKCTFSVFQWASYTEFVLRYKLSANSSWMLYAHCKAKALKISPLYILKCAYKKIDGVAFLNLKIWHASRNLFPIILNKWSLFLRTRYFAIYSISKYIIAYMSRKIAISFITTYSHWCFLINLDICHLNFWSSSLVKLDLRVSVCFLMQKKNSFGTRTQELKAINEKGETRSAALKRRKKPKQQRHPRIWARE